MENTNADAQLDVVEQEEITLQEDDNLELEDDSEEMITIPKSKFNQIRRKALAHDAKKEKPQSINNNRPDAKWQQRMELKVDGYDDQEIDLIIKNGGKEALKNPYIVSAIESVRTQKKAEAAILGAEGQKSGIDKRMTPEAFSKLPHAEQLKVLSEVK